MKLENIPGYPGYMYLNLGKYTVNIQVNGLDYP